MLYSSDRKKRAAREPFVCVDAVCSLCVTVRAICMCVKCTCVCEYVCEVFVCMRCMTEAFMLIN